MKIGLSMWSVHKYWYENIWDTVDFIDFAGSTKAQGVELLSMFWRDKEREIPLIQEALKRNNLQVACFSACNNLAKLKELDRLEQLKDITDSVDTAVLFGAKVVRVFSGDKWDKEVENVPDEQIYEWIIEGLIKAADYAGKNGIALCLENHGRFAATADQVLKIIKDVNSPALGCTFDTGNFLSVGDDPLQAFAKLKNYIPHVHFKDLLKVDKGYEGKMRMSSDGQYYAPKIAGQGSIDLLQILNQLKSLEYDGWISVEFEGEEDGQLGSVESIRYLDEVLKTK